MIKKASSSVSLRNLQYFVKHGVSEEERSIGNRYSLDITVVLDITDAFRYDTLEDTVDYADLKAIADEIMATPTKLLEHLAYKIASKIMEQEKLVDFVTVNIRKHNPPIGAVCDYSEISISLPRSQ